MAKGLYEGSIRRPHVFLTTTHRDDRAVVVPSPRRSAYNRRFASARFAAYEHNCSLATLAHLRVDVVEAAQRVLPADEERFRGGQDAPAAAFRNGR